MTTSSAWSKSQAKRNVPRRGVGGEPSRRVVAGCWLACTPLVFQPQRLRSNMPCHRLQIADAPFQWTVSIEGRSTGGGVHGHDACPRDGGCMQTSAVQRSTVLGSRKMVSDLVPHGRHADV